jgi:hypothetical protein
VSERERERFSSFLSFVVFHCSHFEFINLFIFSYSLGLEHFSSNHRFLLCQVFDFIIIFFSIPAFFAKNSRLVYTYDVEYEEEHISQNKFFFKVLNVDKQSEEFVYELLSIQEGDDVFTFFN